MLKTFLREPLVHFMLFGAALFLMDAWLRPAVVPAQATKIVVDQARIRSLGLNFIRTWQRPPTQQELDGLIESHVREEVLYREAIALGLDRDDTIIRRRLQQKMEFVSDEIAASLPPSNEELSRYLNQNQDAFRIDGRVSFTQVYLDPRRRAANLAADARQLLATLNRARALVPNEHGDPLMLLEPVYDDVSLTDVARLFGGDFSKALEKQPLGQWSGPIASGYGVHLVKVATLSPGGTPSLEEVRPLIEREWANAKRQEIGQAYYEKLRAKYTINLQHQASKP